MEILLRKETTSDIDKSASRFEVMYCLVNNVPLHLNQAVNILWVLFMFEVRVTPPCATA